MARRICFAAPVLLIDLICLSVVSERNVELQVHHTLWGNNVPHGKPNYILLYHTEGCRLIGHIGNATGRAIDLRMAPLFDPSKEYATAFSQLHSLDMLPAHGLASRDFWKLFSKCQSCLHLMTTRTIPYHVCSAPG